MKKDNKETKKPFIIGIAGGSGAGKTTVVINLINTLHAKSITCISHDDYYYPQTDKPLLERKKTNYDHPQSLETELLIKHLQQLQSGQAITKPTYDFTQHTRAKKTETIRPSKVIIVEGILVLSNKALRNLMDLKVFVDADPDIRALRRIKRDMEDRGRSFDYVVEQHYQFTRPMHLKFVEPSKMFADIIIPVGGENKPALELIAARIREEIRPKSE